MLCSAVLAGSWTVPAGILPGEVHLHVATLDPGAARRDPWAVLSPEERAVADGFLFPRDRDRYAVSRAFLRGVLAEYLGEAPERVRLEHTSLGKPLLVGDAELRFNLSHSSGYAVCAVARGVEVGVDLEEPRRLQDADAFAGRLLSPREAESYRRLLAPDRDRWLLRCWTVKEAYLKATGEGITRPMREVEVALEEGAEPALLAVGGDAAEAARWTVLETAPWPDSLCTLVMSRPHGRVRLPDRQTPGEPRAEPPP